MPGMGGGVLPLSRQPCQGNLPGGNVTLLADPRYQCKFELSPDEGVPVHEALNDFARPTQGIQ